MTKKQKPQKVEQLVLVHDPVLGSRYELQQVNCTLSYTLHEDDAKELLESHGIDITTEITKVLTEELKSADNE